MQEQLTIPALLHREFIGRSHSCSPFQISVEFLQHTPSLFLYAEPDTAFNSTHENTGKCTQHIMFKSKQSTLQKTSVCLTVVAAQ